MATDDQRILRWRANPLQGTTIRPTRQETVSPERDPGRLLYRVFAQASLASAVSFA
jgi:hypothetical protein